MESSPEYITFLKNLPPKLRAAWLEGSWEIYHGQYFETFRNDPDHYDDRRWTHVINPIPVRPHWPIYRSFDWGYNKPFSCGYYTVDDDGVIYRIAELYGVQYSGSEALPNVGVKWFPQKVFQTMAQMEKEHPLLAGREIYGVADPAIWDAESGISFAETAGKHGVFFQPADNARIPGWMQMHYRMAFDSAGYCRFYVFKNCRNFIRTITTLEYDPHKPEDLDTKGEDHALDETRYFCMSRPITPHLPEEEPEPAYGADPLDQFVRRNRRR
jgi:hypothetical protein